MHAAHIIIVNIAALKMVMENTYQFYAPTYIYIARYSVHVFIVIAYECTYVAIASYTAKVWPCLPHACMIHFSLEFYTEVMICDKL